MQFKFTCRRCGKAATVDAAATKGIRRSGTGLPNDTERPIIGYIMKCPHCGTGNVLRPEQAT